ncbi:MAG: hypothetical protein ACD_74C00028G0006 [uncultured bacterium]|nr:MAG: hypothetical protein ACD_74C00028G0006 [uncultured bacterium]
MPRNHHRDSFRYASTNHVSDSGSPEIVEDFYTNSRSIASFLPALIKAVDPVGAVAIQEYIREYFVVRLSLLTNGVNYTTCMSGSRKSKKIPGLKPDRGWMSVKFLRGGEVIFSWILFEVLFLS